MFRNALNLVVGFEDVVFFCVRVNKLFNAIPLKIRSQLLSQAVYTLTPRRNIHLNTGLNHYMHGYFYRRLLRQLWGIVSPSASGNESKQQSNGVYYDVQ